MVKLGFGLYPSLSSASAERDGERIERKKERKMGMNSSEMERKAVEQPKSVRRGSKF